MTKADALARNKWVSLLVRLTIVVLFGGFAIQTWIDGPGAFVSSLHSKLDPAGFPHWITTTFGWGLPFLQAALAIWLIIGYRLKAAWFVSGLLFIIFGFGWLVVSNPPLSLLAFIGLLFPIIGLSVSHADNVHA